MMRISTALVLLATLALSACDQPPAPPVVEPLADEPVAPPEALPAPQAKAVQAVSPKPAAPAKVELAPPPTAPVAEVRLPAEKPILPPLDLSLPEEVLQAPSVFAEAPTEPLLPPMFNEPDPDATSFQLHGKLISNERIDSYWESLEGAELHFEFKR